MSTMASTNPENDNNSNNNTPPEEDPAVKELSQQLTDLNTKFCDHFSQQCQEVFAATAPDFPRLEKPDALLQRLKNSYLRHVDVVEVYAARNIFTLDNLPSNRRAKIAALYRQTAQAADVTLELPEHAQADNAQAAVLLHSNIVDMETITANPPPTMEQVQAQRTAVQELQQKIAAARQEQALLQRRVRELEIAQQMASWSAHDDSSKVQESVSALMVGVHGVADCQEQGEAAVQQAKKRRLEAADGDADRLALESLSPVPQNVQELYEQERLRVQTTVKDLQHVHRLLVGKEASDGQ